MEFPAGNRKKRAKKHACEKERSPISIRHICSYLLYHRLVRRSDNLQNSILYTHYTCSKVRGPLPVSVDCSQADRRLETSGGQVQFCWRPEREEYTAIQYSTFSSVQFRMGGKKTGPTDRTGLEGSDQIRGEETREK